jgi:hypothetical protein
MGAKASTGEIMGEARMEEAARTEWEAAAFTVGAAAEALTVGAAAEAVTTKH